MVDSFVPCSTASAIDAIFVFKSEHVELLFSLSLEFGEMEHALLAQGSHSFGKVREVSHLFIL